MDKIIILSEKTDSITSDIMLWIIHYGNKAYRINRDDHNMEILFLSEEYVKIRTSYEIITINRGDYVWCRRSGLYSIFVTKEKNQDTLQKKIFHFQERRDIWQSFFHWIAAHCRFCENPLSSYVNKTDVLEIAKKGGLQIPDWIVTGEKKELIKFLDKHQKLAVKPFNTLNYSNNGYSIKSLTNCITNKNLENINDFFPPLIFQNYIEKKYELRSFLFNNKLYTMAIFSQNDKQTRIDFRHYNTNIPNRNIPFNLPSEYSNKLRRIAKKLNLFSGSFDILVNPLDEYYFLEINPVGQFGMVSYPCNYYLDREIAIYIIHQANGKNNEKTENFIDN